MGFFSDMWDGLKSAGNWVSNAVKDVVMPAVDIGTKILPYVAPLLLKKGGSVHELKDTPANRKKIKAHFLKLYGHGLDKNKPFKALKLGGAVKKTRAKSRS